MPRFNLCNGDWMKLRCGMRVHRVDDPRHEGRVEAIRHGAYVRVTWDGTPKLTEIVELEEITRVREAWERQLEC